MVVGNGEVETVMAPSSSASMPVFLASLSSVGTAAALAASGFYLHRLEYLNSGDGKRTLTRFSQQVALPALFFSKMVACPSTSETAVCPSLWDSLSLQNAWMLVLWPFFVVGCGLVVGHAATWVSHTPAWQRPSICVAVAFANSTGLPTTLLLALQGHASSLWASSSSSLDPNQVLSLYLVFYPLLQWGLGGWLLSTTKEEEDPKEGPSETTIQTEQREVHLEVVPLMSLAEDDAEEANSAAAHGVLVHRPQHDKLLLRSDDVDDEDEETAAGTTSSTSSNACSIDTSSSHTGTSFAETTVTAQALCQSAVARFLFKVICKQPPVCGALLGLLVSSWPPLRHLFVGAPTANGGLSSGGALLQWLLDAISTLGHAAVPMNMAVLGANLSVATLGGASCSANTNHKRHAHHRVSYATLLSVVVGKLVIMPLIGFGSLAALQSTASCSPLPAPVLLVMMMVFLTPTANTVMLMVDLANDDKDDKHGMKEEMARIMAWEYAFAPFILSGTVALAVQMAQNAADS